MTDKKLSEEEMSIDLDRIETVRLETHLWKQDQLNEDWQPCEECGEPGATFQVTEENSVVNNVVLCPDCSEELLIDCEHEGQEYDHWVWKEDCLPWTDGWTPLDKCEWFCHDEYMRQLDSRVTFGNRLEEMAGSK